MNTDKKTKLLAELDFRVSRSGGKGGQNVNKVNTKVELLFSVRQSAGLLPREKELVWQRLGGRISNDGVLHITSQTERTQAGNKSKAISRFIQLMEEALKPPKKRMKTKPGQSSLAKRKEAKMRASAKKQLRRAPEW